MYLLRCFLLCDASNLLFEVFIANCLIFEMDGIVITHVALKEVKEVRKWDKAGCDPQLGRKLKQLCVGTESRRQCVVVNAIAEISKFENMPVLSKRGLAFRW